MIKIKVKDIELSVDEAKEFWKEFNELFGYNQEIVYVPSYWPPFQPEYSRGEITWSSVNDEIESNVLTN